MLIGYAHVSTKDQNLDLQTDALNKAGFIGDRADEHALDMSEDSNTALNEARSKVVSLWYMHSQHHINA